MAIIYRCGPHWQTCDQARNRILQDHATHCFLYVEAQSSVGHELVSKPSVTRHDSRARHVQNEPRTERKKTKA